MSEKSRKLFTAIQKAKVAIEAIKNQKTMSEIAQEYSVHPTQIGVWKKMFWKMRHSCLMRNGAVKNRRKC